jgi:glycerate kinase
LRRFLVAPDSFKGTHDARAVAEAICRGIEAAGGQACACPLADGGEGTADVLLAAGGGEWRRAGVVHDPLGRGISARFALLADGQTAVLDIAEASGLTLLAQTELDPEGADTFGTGELIVAAIEAGAQRVTIAAGGSATTDGGRGAIAAIDAGGGVGAAELEVLCDVRTPFEQAARVFGPQKGAGPEAIERLSARLLELADELPRDPRGLPMSGCAGGLSGGLWAAFEARLTPGAEFVLARVGFHELLLGADVVVSGEGRIDAQSAHGKVVGSVAELCAAAKRDLHVICGHDALDRSDRDSLSIVSIREASTIAELEAAGSALAHSLAA